LAAVEDPPKEDSYVVKIFCINFDEEMELFVLEKNNFFQNYSCFLIFFSTLVFSFSFSGVRITHLL